MNLQINLITTNLYLERNREEKLINANFYIVSPLANLL